MARLLTLKKRAEFLRLRGGNRATSPGFVIEGKQRQSAAGTGARFGFTITKKLGNAVVRNRMRRRLKAALSEVAPRLADDEYDYVVVARSSAVDRNYRSLVEDFENAFKRMHPQLGRQKSEVQSR